MSLNHVAITGNLTKDPVMRGTVLALSVAVNDRWKNPQTDKWEDRPNYIDCIVFGNRAQSLSNILHKGQKVAIDGKLRWSQWQDKETGKNRSKVEVVVNDIEFMSARNDGGAQQAQQPFVPYGAQTPPAAQPTSIDTAPIPF